MQRQWVSYSVVSAMTYTHAKKTSLVRLRFSLFDLFRIISLFQVTFMILNFDVDLVCVQHGSATVYPCHRNSCSSSKKGDSSSPPSHQCGVANAVLNLSQLGSYYSRSQRQLCQLCWWLYWRGRRSDIQQVLRNLQASFDRRFWSVNHLVRGMGDSSQCWSHWKYPSRYSHEYFGEIWNTRACMVLLMVGLCCDHTEECAYKGFRNTCRDIINPMSMLFLCRHLMMSKMNDSFCFKSPPACAACVL